MTTKSRPTPHPRADTTRLNIIKAARKLFVKAGFKQVSMEKIAAKAGVNHSLIYHHFGNKKALWLAVKALIVYEAAQCQPPIPSLDLNWPQFLSELLEQTLSFYTQNPDMIRLINLQRLEATNTRSKEQAIALAAQNWLTAIRHYQEKGEINAKLSAAYISSFILATICSIAVDQQPVIPDNKSTLSYLELCYIMILKATET